MLHTHNPLTHLLHSFFKNKELDELYVSISIKSFAESLVQIFIPIYLFTMGYTISSISFFYMALFITTLVIMPVGYKLNSQLGLKKVLALGTIILLGYYFSLNYIQKLGNVVAIIYGLSIAIYFASFHIFFAKHSSKKTSGTQYSLIFILVTIVSSLGPIIGSLFIQKISFKILFLIVTSVLLASIIPLFTSKDEKVKFSGISLSKFKEVFDKNRLISFFASGAVGITAGVFWPLFIYKTLNSVIMLGSIITITSIFIIGIMVLIGRLSDKNPTKVLKTGVLSNSTSWISRIFFLSPIGVFLNNIFSSVAILLTEIPFSKIIYDDSKNQKQISEYFLFRETGLLIGRLIILTIAILTSSFVWIFITTFFLSFLYLFLLKSNR